MAADGLLALATGALLKSSMVAVTTPRGLLREGNTLLIGAFTVAMAVGPALAGAGLDLTSPAVDLLADGMSFALAAMLLLGATSSTSGPRERLLSAGLLRTTSAYVRSWAGLQRMLASCVVMCLCGAAILPLEAELVTSTLHSSAGSFGTVLAACGLGGVLGSAAVSRIRERSLIAMLTTSFIVMAVSYFGMGSATSIATMIVCSFVGGVGNGIEGYAAMTAIQERADTEFQTRVSALVTSLTSAASGVGFIAGGLVASVVSVRVVYVLAAAAILLCAAAIARASRTTDPRPSTYEHRPPAAFAPVTVALMTLAPAASESASSSEN